MSSFEQLFFRLVFSLLILFSTMVYMFATPILLAAWLLSRNLNAEPLLVGAVTPDATQLMLLFSFGSI